MKIAEAKQALNNGKKIRHRLFMDFEYVYMQGNTLFGEDGTELSYSTFWAIREHLPHFNSGWEIVN